MRSLRLLVAFILCIACAVPLWAAYPVIRISSTAAGASDTAASGAGPDTAATGSQAHTRHAAGELRVGFFDLIPSTQLANVLTDGSHALYVINATAGQRRFASITSKFYGGNYPTILTGTASATSGSPNVDVPDSSIFTVGDVVAVVGAGAASANLYSTVSSIVDADTIALSDNAGTTIANTTLSLPAQVGLATGQGMNVNADSSWAIGGYRATFFSSTSKNLYNNNASAGDVMPGWTVRFMSGHAETVTANTGSGYSWSRSGDATDGFISFEGEDGAAVRPVFTWNPPGNNINLFYANSTLKVRIKGFDIVKTGSATGCVGVAATGGSSMLFVDDVRIETDASASGGANLLTGILAQGVSGNVENCRVGYCTSHGIDASASGMAYFRIVGSRSHHNGGAGAISTPTSLIATQFSGSIFDHNTGNGLTIGGGQAFDGFRGPSFRNCVFDSNGDNGVEITTVSTSTSTFYGIEFQNCILSNNTNNALELSGSGVTAQLFTIGGAPNHGNVFYNNGAVCNVSGVSNYFYNGSTANPAFRSAATGDYTVLNTGLYGAGWPSGRGVTPGAFAAPAIGSGAFRTRNHRIRPKNANSNRRRSLPLHRGEPRRAVRVCLHRDRTTREQTSPGS